MANTLSRPSFPVSSGRDNGDIAKEREQSAALAKILASAPPGEQPHLTSIMDLLPCYVFLMDLNHRIHFSNKTFESFFGPVNGRLCYEALRNREVPCASCTFLDAASNGSSCVSEWTHHNSKHAFRVYAYPFDASDGSRRVMKVGFNVTASSRAQQALDFSEQTYRVITDNLAIGVALLSPDLRIRACNNRLSAWFGHKTDVGERVCDALRCPSYAVEAQTRGGICGVCPFQEAARTQISKENEFPLTLWDGEERVMRLVACPVAPRRGRVQALIMMLEDVTNRLRISQQLQRARKLEAMSTLAGGIAHEINQPLSALHLYASGLQMLLDREEEAPVPPEITRERLSLIMREAERIQGIISHMRILVMREGRVALKPVSLARALSDALAVMRRQLAEREIVVRSDVPESLPLVYSNAGQLEQVLINLLTNSLHALDGVSDKEALKLILVRARVREETGRVCLEVADSGPGLPDGSERIFDPFFTRNGQQGMGLGLSIVHGFVTLWGGQAYAIPRHTELGGAVFFVELRPVSPLHSAPGGGNNA